jgi:hypothetical protein
VGIQKCSGLLEKSSDSSRFSLKRIEKLSVAKAGAERITPKSEG